MPLLLCAATEMEIAPALSQIKQNENSNVDVLITGVGLLSTSFHLSRQLERKKYDCVIQAGVGGGLYPDIPLGKVFLVNTEVVGDLGVNESGEYKSIFDLGFAKSDEFPWTNGRLVNYHPMLQENIYPAVAAVTVNEISTDPARIAYYKNNLQAVVESMEGAALHFACLHNNIPFLQLRSLSNFVGERDKSKWRLKIAIENLNEALLNIIEKL